MGPAASLDLNDVVDGQKIRAATIVFFIVATLLLVSDGFDISVMGYVGPELVKAWHIAPAQLVPAFSAGIVGLMFGGPVLGLLGDRYGRKRVIIAGLCAFGAVSLATMAARNITDLVVPRFITGVGLGGVIPNVVALVAEVTPRRVRGRLIVIITMGVPLGIALPGLVAAALVPRFGWPVLLLVGGILPLGMALVSMFLLPESIKYLMERGNRDAEVRRLARHLRPDLLITDTTRFTLPAAVRSGRRGSPRQLFHGDFAAVTPLLWISNAANQMANFFALTWLPMLLQATGATTAQAGVGASLFSLGGLTGGLVLLFIIDRVGVVPLVILFVLGAPLVAAMGVPLMSPTLHGVIIAGAGLCVTGINLGLTAFLGISYPTTIRSMGAGWAQAAGRVGALAAPVLGGVMLGMHLPIQQLLLAPAAAMVVGAVSCASLAWLCRRRFGGPHLDQFSTIAFAERPLAAASDISVA